MTHMEQYQHTTDKGKHTTHPLNHCVSNSAVNDSYTARYFRLHAVLQSARCIYGLSLKQPASLTLSS